MDAKQTRQGVLLALAAYFIWGIAPAYFKLIYYVPADEILTHRVIWSFFFMVALLSVSRQWRQVKRLLKTPKKIFLLALSAVLVGGNWLLFIWAVNNHHMLEASLGYFINPLVNILLGMIFLGERFRRMQWLAVILAVCGVLVQLWTFGSLPIIALGLAFSLRFTAWCVRRSPLKRRRVCWSKRYGCCRSRQFICLALRIAPPAIWGKTHYR
ncbi:chloramphenicol-sensitive protein RarD [Salmonella enterica subsp. enterica]|uniref:Chloramphenicol-sensitive protein RarD n=1 Tax=Salmonella enterica I TaxID=59201 RepID=A0A379X4G0_SALET|nr:chloramphenicol-sensitive protein RarD [Salmonella enterica subsp. enterica]